MSRKIIYKNPKQIDSIRESGKYLTELLFLMQKHAKAGVSGVELEEIAEAFLQKNNITGAFKGYEGFPANLCVSINDCVVHAIPDNTVFKEGDLVKIDAGVNYQGGISDAAISMVIGGKGINKKADHLITTTKGALDNGLKKFVKTGESIFYFGKFVGEYMEKYNCSIIKNLTGHGVGVDVHEGPSIYNRANEEMKKYSFETNMVVALEPITAIKSNVYKEKKGVARNLYTEKGDLGAQWEYTVLITENGYEILAGVVNPDRI